MTPAWETMQASAHGKDRLVGHIFVSYSRKDRGFADDVLRDLTGRGLNCWMDVRDVDGGTQWRADTGAAIRECDTFLIILSQHSIRSADVMRELALAESSRRRIVPILYQQVVLPDAMQYSLTGLQWVDFVGPTYEDAFQRLMRALQPEDPTPPSDPKFVGWIAGAYVLVGVYFLSSFGTCLYASRRGHPADCVQSLGLSYTNLALMNVLLGFTIITGIVLFVRWKVAAPVLIAHWVLQALLTIWFVLKSQHTTGLMIALIASAPIVFYIFKLNRQEKSAANRFSH